MSLKQRFRASLIHLSASALLALLALGLVFCVWYPAPLHLGVGVSTIVLVLIGVDVVIGPLLTFVVYRVGKKSLRFDLATIVVLQLGAFIYGMSTIATGRPAWLVYNADRFDLVQAHELDDTRLDRIPPEYRGVSWGGPRWVSAQPPADTEERNKLTFESVFAGVDLPQRPDLYRTLVEARGEIRRKALPLSRLERFNSPSAVKEILKRWPQADAYLPMMCKIRPLTVLIRKETSEVIAVVDLSPWD